MMGSFATEPGFGGLESTRNGLSEASSYIVNDFNLNDFFKCIKHNKLKKAIGQDAALNGGASGNPKHNNSGNGTGDNGAPDEVPPDPLTFKRSRLLNRIGAYKAEFPDRMTISEYLLNSYVVLFTPNPVTLYSYESVLKNMSPGTWGAFSASEEFWKTLRTLTSVHLEVDKFPNEVGSNISMLLESGDEAAAEDTKTLDTHFTWLCKCCINVADFGPDDEGSTPNGAHRRYSTESDDLRASARKLLNSNLTLANIFNKNYDLASDVLYEALRQRGNRFVQRSLYNNIKNAGAMCSRGVNPNVAAKLGESNARIKKFVDIIQQSSLDSADPASYNNYCDLYGDERRHSSRRAMLMRKRYC